MKRPIKTTSRNNPPAVDGASLIGRCPRHGGRVYIFHSPFVPQAAITNPRDCRRMKRASSDKVYILCDVIRGASQVSQSPFVNVLGAWTRSPVGWNPYLGGFQPCASSPTARPVTRSGPGCSPFRSASAAVRPAGTNSPVQAGRGLGDSGATARPSSPTAARYMIARPGVNLRGPRSSSDNARYLPLPASAGPAPTTARFHLIRRATPPGLGGHGCPPWPGFWEHDMVNEIIIDPEFSALIPPLDPGELERLELNLKADGCRDALVVWKGENILLDGHHRKAICKKHDIPFRVQVIELPNRDAAMDWIDANQLGRRNLKPDQISLLRGRIYNRAKGKQGGDRGNQYVAKCQSDTLADDTAFRLAHEHGVSPATIKRDGQFAAAVEKLTPSMPDLPKQIASGKGPAKTRVVEASKSPARAAEILAATAKPQIMSVEEYEADASGTPKRRGMGIQRANEAINILQKIPKNDALRAEGFDTVTRWIRLSPCKPSISERGFSSMPFSRSVALLVLTTIGLFLVRGVALRHSSSMETANPTWQCWNTYTTSASRRNLRSRSLPRMPSANAIGRTGARRSKAPPAGLLGD